jgi:diguanylate cyclase (GGDEF)-like protein
MPPGFEQVTLSNMGVAEIGLGHLRRGKRQVEGAIEYYLARNDLADAHDTMRDYLAALEGAGDVRGALEVSHRDDTLRDQLMTTAGEQALRDLSAKLDSERRTRQIELLQRDNAIKGRDLQAQRQRQQMIVMAAALVTLTCAALVWGISRIRRVNARLLHNSRHDALTGLLNRQYFNEYILAQQGDRAYFGCLLLIDIDHFRHINDTLGHSAGDAVLAALSKRLLTTLRDSEAVVRWGSDEFLGLLGPMSDAQLNLAVRRLLAAIRSEPVAWDGQSMQFTVSIGYASFPVTGAATDIPLERAVVMVGEAVRQAKREGRDRACPIVRVHAGQRRSELNALRECDAS